MICYAAHKVGVVYSLAALVDFHEASILGPNSFPCTHSLPSLMQLSSQSLLNLM
jgi:hypothetical protein